MTPQLDGLDWHFEVRDPAGKLLDRFDKHNLMPKETRNFALQLLFKSGTVVPTWYIGLYLNDWTPTDDVTAATLPGLAGECTSYTPSSRVEYQEGAVADGSVSNAAAQAEFTFTADVVLHGAFMSSAAAKGATTGILASVVRFPSPRSYPAGSVLRAFAGQSALAA